MQARKKSCAKSGNKIIKLWYLKSGILKLVSIFQYVVCLLANNQFRLAVLLTVLVRNASFEWRNDSESILASVLEAGFCFLSLGDRWRSLLIQLLFLHVENISTFAVILFYQFTQVIKVIIFSLSSWWRLLYEKFVIHLYMVLMSLLLNLQWRH